MLISPNDIDIKFNNNQQSNNLYLECSICLSTISNPHIVPCCKQSFCKSCLDHALSLNTMCPLCREFINITDTRFNLLYNALLPNNQVESNDNEFKVNEIVKWKNTLNKIEKHILEKNRLPSYTFDSNNDIRELGYWVYTQKFWYKKKWYIMKNKEIRHIWEVFNEKYPILTDINQWKFMLNEVIKYKKKNKKLPSFSNSFNRYDKELGWWLNTQEFWYKNKWHIMKNEEIRILWKKFIKN